jgi:hypothetical protein
MLACNSSLGMRLSVINDSEYVYVVAKPLGAIAKLLFNPNTQPTVVSDLNNNSLLMA